MSTPDVQNPLFHQSSTLIHHRFRTVSETPLDRFPTPMGETVTSGTVPGWVETGNCYPQTVDNFPLSTAPTMSLAEHPRPRRHANPYLHLEGRAPRAFRASWCRHCRAPVVIGTDQDECADIVCADTTPISAIGEMLALLGNRQTYTVWVPFAAGHPRLIRRTGREIRLHPAEKPQRFWHRYDVIPKHVCGSPIVDALTIPTMLALESQRLDPHAAPPF